MNKILVTGRLVADPEVKQTTSGVLIATILIAVKREYKDKNTGKYESDFLRFKAFDKKANFLDIYVKKGDQIEIEGYIANNNYEKAGILVYQNEFIANKIGHLSSTKTNNTESDINADYVDF